MDILIVGGTGSLGKVLLDRYYKKEHCVTIFSRDELKQAELRKEYPECEYILGNIQSMESVCEAFQVGYAYDIVFLCAAYKHVDIGEYNVREFVKTNFLGACNVLDAAIANQALKFVYFTTDKACLPINAYGMSKAIFERHVNSGKYDRFIDLYTFRWGNILGSRGSAVEYFKKTLEAKTKVKLTDPSATRFWLLLDEAVDFVMETIEIAPVLGHVHIPDMKSSDILTLLEAVYNILKNKGTELLPFDECYIPTCLRPGEKIHEHITETMTSDTCEKFSVFELMQKVERLDYGKKYIGSWW